MKTFTAMMRRNHEQVVFGYDRDSGLRAIIAIHDTTLGPALGGTRMWPYKTEDEALNDVLRLSRGMTYKAAAAGLNLGGGKAVIIGGPHTSNWDGIYTLAAMMQLGLDAHVMIKDSAFKGPFGAMLRWMGALPIARHKAGGVVEQTVAQFNSRDKLVMVVAPEGTRGGATQWKTGFYRIAEQAGVPIVLATADYQKKEITFARVIEPCGDVEKDLEHIFQCYAQVEPRHPEKLSAPLKAIRDKR